MSAPDSREVQAGMVIAGTYEITGLLGQGGMGAVWAARHLRLPGRRVAIKVLLAEASADSAAFARFRREAEIASRIGHPNIVDVLDFNTLPSGTPYLVLEYLTGETLGARLARGRLELAHALDIARQVGSALHAAHREQVVHRDLKPDNIFLCPSESGGVVSETVKVLDFGISKIRGSRTVQTLESALLGTPQYMSPEQAFGKNDAIDARTDVFALATIVYEMLTGRMAFAGDSLAQVVLAIVQGPSPSLAGVPGIPARVVAAVDRALAKQPEARSADMASFIGELTGKPLETLGRRRVSGADEEARAATLASDSGAAPAVGAPRPVSSPAPLAREPVPHATTAARGELMAPALPPTRQSSRGRGWLVGVAVAVGAAAVALGYGLRQQSAPPPAMAVAATPGVAEDMAQPAARVEAPAPHAAVAAAGQQAPGHQAPDLPAPSAAPSERRARPDPVLSPALAAELDAAERALAQGNASDALLVARRTLNTQKSSRAFAIIARAYCKRGDLGNARAALFSVAARDRAGVLRACRKDDIDLR